MAKAKWYQALLYLLVAVVLSLGVVAVPGNALADGGAILFEQPPPAVNGKTGPSWEASGSQKTGAGAGRAVERR